MRLDICLLIALCQVLAWQSAPNARADLVLSTETREMDQPTARARSGRIWLDGSKMRLEFEDPALPGEPAIVIFRADRDLYWALDARSQSYVQIDREAIEALGQRVQQTRREMASRLEHLEPDQRAAVEEMLGEMLMPQAAAPLEKLVATERRQQIAGLPARLHHLLLSDEVVGEVWLTGWKKMDVKRRDFRVFKKLAAFQRELMQTLGRSAGAAFGSQPFEVFDHLDGFPLLIRRLQDGRIQSETRFGLVEKVPSLRERYELPSGYQRRASQSQPH